MGTDQFLVDTNVWYWMTYLRFSQQSPTPIQAEKERWRWVPTPRQETEYPAYVNKALAVKARLLRCGLSLSELVHRIERAELDIYNDAHGLQTRVKDYRQIETERTNVVRMIRSAWKSVESASFSLPVHVTRKLTNAALTRLSTQTINGYDLFLLEAMNRARVTQVITDDSDYATVPGITVFTSHREVILEAGRQNQLVQRP
jgi:predicted nucleic acid-binding protein